jgi:hypothetical protein
MGIPTVTISSSEFVSLAKDTAIGKGASDMSFVVVPHPMGMVSLKEIREKAERVFPLILKEATEWKPEAKLPTPKPIYPAPKMTFEGTIEEFNRYLMDKGFSLGLPVLPPTPERVERMLKGTKRKPNELLGMVPPRMGALTIELVAIHAAMAGCKPEYMPLLIAILEGLLDPRANWRGIQTTTATSSILVIINGPIIYELGVASRQGAAGSGHHLNASIGYAINLIGEVVGGSRPPSPDKSLLGGPGDFVAWVFGENQLALPKGWEPYHVDRGFKKEDNVVTVMGIYPPVDNIDHWSMNPEEHLNWWSYLVTPLLSIGGPCWISQMDQPHLIALGPEHAQLIAGAGWSKKQFRDAFWEKARIPFSAWPKGCPNIDLLIKRLGPVSPNTPIPITLRPEELHIVIAGGAGKHSHFFAPFPGCFPISKMIHN